MKASIITSSVALFTSALAAPLASASGPVYFTFSLANDMSGANAATSVQINAAPVTLGSIFPWATNLRKDGKLIATSAQNINPAVQNVFCIFTNPINGAVIRINDKITFADLDGNRDKAVETDVTNFTIQCQR
ncbi:hypothetical protein BKA63DRAFT_136972 [Paraphoma chrysanthemicola]|nr:hypothetical protein BKA63DRAFT_136972 [Paraphoma chrysanthemicola]